MTSIRCSFCVFSTILLPDRITQLLGVRPDHTVMAGKTRTPPRLTPKANGWYLECKATNTRDAEALLQELVNRALPTKPGLAELRRQDRSARVACSMAITPFSHDVPLFFSAGLVKQISELGASFDIDFFEDDERDVNS